jgi:hypothetical protein
MPLFNPRSLQPLTKDQVRLRISKSIDLILQDWLHTLHPSPAPHDYAGIYAPSVSFRIAHDQTTDKKQITGGSGFSVNSRFYFQMVHRVGKFGLRAWVNSRYSRPRISCFTEPPSSETGLSFKWLIEGIPNGTTDTKDHSLILGGMAHYRFSETDGRVNSILIDRLIPPFRPGLTILEYLRTLQLQHKSIYSIEKPPPS